MSPIENINFVFFTIIFDSNHKIFVFLYYNLQLDCANLPIAIAYLIYSTANMQIGSVFGTQHMGQLTSFKTGFPTFSKNY